MQKKNKIIIWVTSLIFIIAIVVTMKFRIAKINNNALMKNEVSSIPKSEENEINKDKESSKDTTSSASENEEAIKEDNSKASNSKEGDAISSASGKEKNKLVVSKNINHKKNSQNKEKDDTTSGASIKEENYLSSALKLNKLSEYTNYNNEQPYNKKENIISSASKKQHENIPITINEKHENKDGSNKNENKTVTLDEVKISNDVVSSASKKEHENIKNTLEKSEIKANTDNFMNKAINEKATKLVDLGWAKYIVVTFNEGTINDYDLYVLDNESYKAITPSNVDDSGKIVKWEIDKLGYNTIKIKSKNSREEVIYKFVK